MLENSTLTYYEDFDTKTQEPINKKGSVSVLDCTFGIVHKENKKDVFVINREEGNPLYLQAETEQLKFSFVLFSFSVSLFVSLSL